MPSYKGHLFGGTIFFALAIFFCSLHLAPCMALVEWLACVLAGSLFPDIDTKSKGQKLLYLAVSGGLLYCILSQKFKTAGILACAAMLPLLAKHRGLFHHLWFLCMLVSGAAFYLIVLYPALRVRIITDAAFFMLGIASHIYLDMGLKRMLRLS